MNDTIGIDISKDTLDTFWLSKRKHKQFANTKMGLRALTSWIREAEVSLVVFEATGVYHRLLEVSLATHDFSFARVNPRQARRFAEGTGTLAKTDRVDAAMLARMGSLLELQADKPKSETLHNLKGMTTARQALLLVHVNMHCQATDQGSDGCQGSAGNRNIPIAQEAGHSAPAPG